MERTIEEVNSKIPIIYIQTDGNINGDYMQGMIIAYEEIAKQLVDRSCKANPYLVNLYGEKSIANATDDNIKILSRWLDPFGATIHCRYLNNTTSEKNPNLKRRGITYQCL